MDRNSAQNATQQSVPSTPTRAWYFAQAILGNPIPHLPAAESEARAKRERLEWLATFSSEHASQLRRLLSDEAEARRQREQLEWLAKISPVHESELRRLQAAEAEIREVQEYAQRLYEETTLLEGQWDPAKHPRGAFSQNAGWFSPSSGSGGGATHSKSSTPGDGPTGPGFMSVPDKTPKQRAKFDPSNSYLPSETKGKWLGKKGNSTFRLTTPRDANGKLVRDIKFIDGIPNLEEFTLPGKTASIILTGDRVTDAKNAEIAWKKLNPGRTLPENTTFHHDLLNATTTVVEIDGKKTKVLVGKMPLVPRSINRAVFHEGTASIANKLYQGLGSDQLAGIRKLAREEAALVAAGSKVVASAVKRIKSGTVDKVIRPFTGRNIVRAIPIGIGTGLAVVEFAENVEAHGIGGAVIRATPLLGDLVSAYDLGSDLAKQITDEANASLDTHTAELNSRVSEAWHKASQQTIDVYAELGSQIEVTRSVGSNGRVDPTEIVEALNLFRARMQQANLLKAEQTPNFDFDKAAADAKQDLKDRLTRAAQPGPPAPRESFF